MNDRPDLSQVDPEVVAYIEALEARLLAMEADKTPAKSRSAPPLEPAEPPTTLNIVSISRDGLAKRTPRHFYDRQRRGGMGVFDLETSEEDPPTLLAMVDEGQDLLLFTNHGRAFRIPALAINETPVRGRGTPLADHLPFSLQEDERFVAAIPGEGDKYVVLFSRRGWVRRIMANYLGPRMLPGTTFHDLKNGGPLAAACWSAGSGSLFIATRSGQAIRFNEKQVPTSGCRGLRVGPDDEVVAGAAVAEDGGVFLLGHDGKGTIRLMSGFRANKAPGAGGKVALKTDRLTAALTVTEEDDLFILSQQGKIIRFRADEIPAKAGAVQGVNCMSLRADETAAAIKSS